MTMEQPLEVVGAKALKKAFETLTDLWELSKSTTPPKNALEAMVWIRSAPDKESRRARKLLSFGMMYGAGPQPINLTIKKLKKS